MTILLPSTYAITFHENPTEGNNLPYDEAVAYNEVVRKKTGTLIAHREQQARKEAENEKEVIRRQKLRERLIRERERITLRISRIDKMITAIS